MMSISKITERNGNTLIEGMIGEKSVFYANKSNDETILKLKNRIKKEHDRNVKESVVNRPNIRTTTTYDRWYKNHTENFASWFGKDRLK